MTTSARIVRLRGDVQPPTLARAGRCPDDDLDVLPERRTDFDQTYIGGLIQLGEAPTSGVRELEKSQTFKWRAQPERILIVDRIPAREPVEVEPPRQPDRVFLREVIPFDAVVRLCAAKSVCCPHLVARLSGYSVVRFVSRPRRAVSRGSPPVRARRRVHGGQHCFPLSSAVAEGRRDDERPHRAPTRRRAAAHACASGALSGR